VPLSFILLGAILGIGALVCGHIALSAAKRNASNASRNVALIGTVLGYLSVAIAAAILALQVGILSVFPLAGNAGAVTDSFGNNHSQFNIDFVPIGNLRNKPDMESHGRITEVDGQLQSDPNGRGRVDYFYWISKYTISQKDLSMAIASGLENVPKGKWSDDKPAAPISWHEAAAFVNWLNTSKGYEPAYNLQYSEGRWSMQLWDTESSAYDPNNPYRNKNSVYVLPSENEFYKAAFGKKDGLGYTSYSTGSNEPPQAIPGGTEPNTMVCNQKNQENPASVYEAGGLSSYGTMGQIGNISQWLESSESGNNADPNARRLSIGLDWHMDQGFLLFLGRGVAYDPDFKNVPIGMRVVRLQKSSD
jgi:formylglycine-generating enzyme required for sulfatase activity